MRTPRAKSTGHALARVLQVLVICVLVYAIKGMLSEPEASVVAIQQQEQQKQATWDAELQEPIYRDKSGKRINSADHALMMGYDTAKEEGLRTHAQCKEKYANIKQGLERMGCQKYVTEEKHFPPHIQQANWNSGKTTAQCKEEVSAHWDARIQDSEERGESADAVWSLRSHRGAEMQECQNYDNVRGVSAPP